MGLAELGLQEVQTRTIAPAGDYPLEIAKLEMKTAKTGREMVVATVNIVGGNYKPIWNRLNLPVPSDADTTKAMFIERIAEFCDGFNIPRVQFVEANLENFKGMTGQWILGMREATADNDEENIMSRPSRNIAMNTAAQSVPVNAPPVPLAPIPQPPVLQAPPVIQ